MERADAIGIGASVAGHGALFVLMAFVAINATREAAMPPAMEVSYVDEVGLVSGSPNPVAAAAPPAATELGPVEQAAPSPETSPAPAAAPSEVPARQPARPQPAQAGARGSGAVSRAPGLNLNPNSFGSDPQRAAGTPGAVMSTAAAASIAQAIQRQIQPCADRQVNPGPGAERIVTPISLRLNRDGSLVGRPRVGRQRGLDDENSRYAQRVADLAVNAFVSCAPLRGLPQELYDVPRGWSNFTMNYRLPA
ncbi:MAG: hypothetical protein QOD42_296 [Sphingomonadales bacterium]|jgi:hypothetical protein|nr:hypothetical protein [Sphingomonadales bacterium]